MYAKKKINVCYIVLHYMDIKLTIDCIESIIHLPNNENSVVIVVDNCSPNGSYNLLRLKYNDVSSVYVIKSDKNNGFSEGNNYAFAFYKSKFIADFVVVANNDVIFNQSCFVKILYEEYAKERFYVAGPDIYVPSRDIHQNPISKKLRTIVDMDNAILRGTEYCRELKKPVSKAGILLCLKESRNSFLVRCLLKMKHKTRKEVLVTDVLVNPVLFGACLIFSKQFCEINTSLFEPYTFMYGEEDFLALKCFLNSWKTVYLPKLKVIHINQGSSALLQLSYRDICDRAIKNSKRCMDSYFLYREIYKKSMLKKEKN